MSATARRRSPSAPKVRRPNRAPRAIAIAAPSAAPVLARVAGVRRRIAAKFATVGAMAGVALILVSTTVPANAFVEPFADDASASVNAQSAAGSTQEMTVADAAAPVVTRDTYTAVSQQQQFASRAGNRDFSYTNNPAGTIQWPFPSGAPITSGFGPRHVAGCGFCSTNHQGLDFTPGSGYPINAVADGVVSLVQVSGGGLGNEVIIDHVVNGQKVQSVYGHMQYGSIKVAEGQSVTVGQVIGNVGSTGASTGAHLHLEIHLGGTPIDPFAWLQANAN